MSSVLFFIGSTLLNKVNLLPVNTIQYNTINYVSGVLALGLCRHIRSSECFFLKKAHDFNAILFIYITHVL